MTVTILCILALLEHYTDQSASRNVMICFIIKNLYIYSLKHIYKLTSLARRRDPRLS